MQSSSGDSERFKHIVNKVSLVIIFFMVNLTKDLMR